MLLKIKYTKFSFVLSKEFFFYVGHLSRGAWGLNAQTWRRKSATTSLIPLWRKLKYISDTNADREWCSVGVLTFPPKSCSVVHFTTLQEMNRTGIIVHSTPHICYFIKHRMRTVIRITVTPLLMTALVKRKESCNKFSKGFFLLRLKLCNPSTKISGCTTLYFSDYPCPRSLLYMFP